MFRSATMPGHVIRRLHQHSTHIFAKRLRESGFDLTPVQFAALDALRHLPGTDQASLADTIGADRATTGEVVDRLQQKGLLRREVAARDRRARELFLTKTGEELLLAVAPIVEGLQGEILQGLDEEEYRLFVTLAIKAWQTAEPLT